jgi:putative GTP pyrophosphokinase
MEENLKTPVEIVLAEFDGKKELLSRLCETTKRLVEKSLEAVSLRPQYVQARVKSKEKLRTKYLDPNKGYTKLDDITDQAGLRVITYYEDEVDRVAEVIKKEFDFDEKNSIDKREVDPEKFGYYALNYVCGYLGSRTSHIEYREFAGIAFEIQITSILRHAWSEIEHPWYDLKDAFPDDIKRRFARMAALLEIAESEFLSLRKLQSDYTRSLDVQVAAKFADITVDAASIRPFLEQEPLLAQLDNAIAQLTGRALSKEISGQYSEFVSRVARQAGLTTLAQIREALNKYGSWVSEYVEACQQGVWKVPPSHAPIQRGVGITHLAMLLLGIKGDAALAKALEELQINPPADHVAGQLRVARQIAAKHPM